ncbi:MAG: LuxR C-terminal-related transcriptional regulator [Microthrixaceae bacterium]
MVSAPSRWRELDITQKTVHNHLNTVYRKLDTQSLTHAVISAVRLGIIQLAPPDPSE